MTSAVGLTWIPPVSCPCGGRHLPGSRYYVSVLDGGRWLAVVGPFLTHQAALGRVEVVSRVVCERYNPDGRADFYAYGTVAMPHDYVMPGQLNPEVLGDGTSLSG